MVEKYVPKVGDKVRATLGENVLVGDVSEQCADDLVEVLLAEDECLTLDLSLWQFERVVSVPTKFGAVIRRADGVMLSLQDAEARNNRWLAPSDGWQWCDDAEATAGGFTVLFDGVDE